MKKRIGTDALGIGATVFALLAACSGSQPPSGAPSALPQTRAAATHVIRSGSWMLPEAKGKDLLYAAGSNLGSVDVFSFPAGKLVGTLTGFIMPAGECADAAGDVWVTDTTARYIYEYAHGGTSPIATLSVPDDPLACSIDPQTGNLAVTSGSNTVSIFRDARGEPRSYSDDQIALWYFCAYDSMGNLFLSGENWEYRQKLVEQPYGESRFTPIAGVGGFPEDAPVVWDGQYVAVQASASDYPANEMIERIRIAGREGTVEETATFRNNPPANSQFLTFRGDVVQGGIGGIGVWTYAPSGKIVKVIKSDPSVEFLGVAVSVAASR